MSSIKKFDVETVELAGKNLIEASAGTGKTYSIAVMVLRMIIENRIPVEKILMVTFTKAAVAELESRIRKFVRLAYRYSSDKGAANETIRNIVDRTGKQASVIQLKKAIQCLDQLSVMTIHSFCERSLMQFPFETGQSFRFEIATDISDLRELVVNDYWRRKINTLEPDLYSHFTEFLNREMIGEILKKALDDKEYLCGDIDEDAVLQEIKSCIGKSDDAWLIFKNHIIENFEKIKGKQITGPAKKFIEKNNASPAVFTDAYIEGFKKETKYISESFPEEYRLFSDYIAIHDELVSLSNQYIYNLFKLAIETLTGKVKALKTSRRVIDFNDQIALLHQAVDKGLVNSVLAEKYSAVFIDEFQDTDKHQYEIFSKIFSEKTVFYIGDPKQSIYGWRKADIATYKAARNDVDAIYSMNLNFRSTADLIDELNNFFGVENPFADNEIGYNEVELGLQNLGSLTENNEPSTPFDIYGINNKEEIKEFVVNEVSRLISSDELKINGERIKPSDIAIIVRTNKEGRATKESLSEAGIPAITIDESKVMDSDEVEIIRYLMMAVIQTDRGAMNRVLLNPCFGLDSTMIDRLDDEKHLENFRELRQIWVKSGVYNMLFRFYDLYQVRHHTLNMGIEGQRILTNLYQIAEILHQAELKSRYTPAELLAWCHRAQNDSNDEYLQRVESQEDAVQITTIHKCKGLTYKIVLAPYLDLKITRFPVFEFREEGRYKFTHQPTAEQDQLWREQIEQENRRLIYVALTRAQYKVILCINNSKVNAGSSIKNFQVQNQTEWIAPENEIRLITNRTGDGVVRFSSRPKPEGLEIKNTFGIHSFSALSKGHHSAPLEIAADVTTEGYDQFIFRDLGRGANVGTALHSIFERLEFSKPDTWLQTILDASKYYPNIIKEKNEEKNIASNIDLIHQMVNNVMNSEINIEGTQFRLCEVDDERKLAELNFLFSLDKVNRQVVKEFLGEDAKLGGETDIEGLMTGFMDLMFEHKGKYYILDWKSNHIGNSVNDYNRPGMEVAMTASNYHLQYMIYTVALKRWLGKRIDNFNFEAHYGGIIYVFLRGVREGQKTGIYTNRPEKGLIEKLDIALGRQFYQSNN